jgi:hypothetical protein
MQTSAVLHATFSLANPIHRATLATSKVPQVSDWPQPHTFFISSTYRHHIIAWYQKRNTKTTPI